MFCSKCGASNTDEAQFCKACGNPLKSPSDQTPLQQAQPSPVSAPPGQPGDKKSPVVAAILNLFIGLGYVYLGYRKVLGLPTLLFVFAVLIIQILLTILTFWLLPLVIAVLMAYDGYVKAEGQRGLVSAEPPLTHQ